MTRARLAFLALGLVSALVIATVGLSCATMANLNVTDHAQKSPVFQGAKVNAGTVTCAHQGKDLVLTLSDDFVIPDTPAPHWQLVDSRGNAYLLNRLKIKEDKLNKSVVVPSYVPDVAKVQIWCAFAEVLLGETELVCSHGGFAEASARIFSNCPGEAGFTTWWSNPACAEASRSDSCP